ncbi:16S rRNA (cytidine1402-2'-O)-methyltransferase [Natronobacillus azotifigens]|uniref:Ribosomal RNA small subunit methyltransferase I n=1 Tax=Natronobacillus azotifigens TaxID=472978 RepID=A0A9J6RE51_9BACI|nr:16S rRNA (cytidine(1402)-2'-O)-methyltransferase [Natronobacillus azotifigens]MCZ0703620.1 16S rRNA (cytidine(1402)-2'-O)-methyltransferase [Natronobacillus azotifigens]
MKTQKSFDIDEGIGTLFIVPTPIGNLEDITIRAINTLKTVDLIAAEDTRNTKKLLNHFEIHQTLISYHEHSQEKRANFLVDELKQGRDIALVSDAGMPAISDPGTELVQEVIGQGLPVVTLPGANAGLCALVGSGLPTENFYFYGFLPRKKKDRAQAFELLQKITTTFILYESPYRLIETLNDIKNELGNRKIAVARELTKRFEEYIRGTVDEVMEWSKDGTIKGEFCIIIEGGLMGFTEETNWWETLSIIEHVDRYIEKENITSKEAIKKVALERKIPKREVYQNYHLEQE